MVEFQGSLPLTNRNAPKVLTVRLNNLSDVSSPGSSIFQRALPCHAAAVTSETYIPMLPHRLGQQSDIRATGPSSPLQDCVSNVFIVRLPGTRQMYTNAHLLHRPRRDEVQRTQTHSGDSTVPLPTSLSSMASRVQAFSSIIDFPSRVSFVSSGSTPQLYLVHLFTRPHLNRFPQTFTSRQDVVDLHASEPCAPRPSDVFLPAHTARSGILSWSRRYGL